MTRATAAELLAQAVMLVDLEGQANVLPGDHPAARQLVEQLHAAARNGYRQCGHVSTATTAVWLPNLPLLTCDGSCSTDALASSSIQACCVLCGTTVDHDDPPWWTCIWDRALIVAIVCPTCSTDTAESTP